MSIPSFTIRDLLTAGVHFGHQPRKWNPKMAPYIFGTRSGIHILNLEKSAPMLFNALRFVHDTVAKGGRVLFVGTKRQASDIVAESAKRCAQYYVNHRWLGGMLTNWNTISQSIRRLNATKEQLALPVLKITKKEQLKLQLEMAKLERNLGGILEMNGAPDVLFVVDVVKEHTAISEARKLGIPIVAITDTNADPESVDFPIPGNDDASRAIDLYCRLMADTIIEGLKKQISASGLDLGARSDLGGDSLGASRPRKAKPAAAINPVTDAADVDAVVSAGESKASQEGSPKASVLEEEPAVEG
ncbi:MAG: 30S ribosomal protein S2 [Alphaproteobacteria bacterium]|nr:MAG: 30S ribosomal protein S2 [Alphaproteobacteria bacterium]